MRVGPLRLATVLALVPGALAACPPAYADVSTTAGGGLTCGLSSSGLLAPAELDSIGDATAPPADRIAGPGTGTPEYATGPDLATTSPLLDARPADATMPEQTRYTIAVTPVVAPVPPAGQSAVVTGGPWVAPGATSVTVACAVSVNDDVADPSDPSASHTTGGEVGYLPPTVVEYERQLLSPVYLCTQVTVYRSGRVDIYRGDADGDPSNGAQCRKTEDHGRVGQASVSPMLPSEGTCVLVEFIPSPPAPYDHQSACVPRLLE